MKRLFILFILLASNIILNAQVNDNLYLDNIISNIKNVGSKSEFIVKDFPISSNTKSDITLYKVESIIDDRTKFVISNNFKLSSPILNRFIGKSIDNNNDIFVTIIDNKLYCNVENINGERYYITPNINNYTISNVNDNSVKFSMPCSSIEPPTLSINYPNKESKILSSTKLQVNIAIDVCKEWYLWKFKGDTIKIRDYILSAYSMVSFIYEKEMNIRIHIPWFNISTTSDTYNSGGTSTEWGGMPSTVLEAMPSYWKNNNLDVKADLVHAVSVGGRGGVGNYNALVTGIHDGNKWGPFAAISINGDTKYPLTGSPYLSFDFDVHTIAHEMGHNFNCPHTHSCYFEPPIDTCVIFENNNDGCPASGTKRICTQFTKTSIMSYCREINNWVSTMTFLDRPASLIRTYAEKYLKEVNTSGVEDSLTPNIKYSRLEPNPAKTSIWLYYDLTKQTYVNITIYDITGKKIIIILDEIQNAAGYSKHILLDSRLFPIGTYNIVITTDSSLETLSFIKI